MAEELHYARRLLQRASDQGIYTWEPPERLLPTSTWTERRSDLASGSVTEKEWLILMKAYIELDRLNWHLRDVMREEPYIGGGPAHPLEARKLAPAARVAEALTHVENALEVTRGLRAADTSVDVEVRLD